MPNSIRPKLSFANVVALVALFVALGGSAYAVSKGEIRSRQIADGAVKSKDLRDDNVKSRDIKDGQLTSADVRDEELTGDDLFDGTVGAADLADGGVTGEDLADGEVGGEDLAPSAVGRAHLAARSVGFEQIDDDAVSTEQIEGGAVGSAEIAERSVRRRHIAIDCPQGRFNFAGLCFDRFPQQAVDSVFTAADTCRRQGGRLPTALQLRGVRDSIEINDAETLWTDALFFEGGLRSLVVSGSGGISIAADGSEHLFVCVFEPLGL